jgi:hypothetical protein
VKATTFSAMTIPDLLERDDVMTLIERRLERARGGMGGVVLLGAEAGGGKTSVARTLARRLGEKASVHWGECDALSLPRPPGPPARHRGGPRSPSGCSSPARPWITTCPRCSASCTSARASRPRAAERLLGAG